MNFIESNQDGNTVTMRLEGWLDVMASPLLEQAIDRLPPDVTKLIIDCSELDYVSSSGLRAFLLAHKKMSGKEGLVLKGVNDDVRDILDISGFLKRLNVQ